jgi:hypothetical protein
LYFPTIKYSAWSEAGTVDAPKVLFLYVLSHGESGGKILRDHFKIKASVEKNSNLKRTGCGRKFVSGEI